MVDGEFCKLPREACLVFSLAMQHWDATQKTPGSPPLRLGTLRRGPGQAAGNGWACWPRVASTAIVDWAASGVPVPRAMI